jgi:hypothetical protein
VTSLDSALVIVERFLPGLEPGPAWCLIREKRSSAAAATHPIDKKGRRSVPEISVDAEYQH